MARVTVPVEVPADSVARLPDVEPVLVEPVSAADSAVYRCTEAFSVFPVGGAPLVYGPGHEVSGSDPILVSHRSYFQVVGAELRRAPVARVEQATAAPGELRTSPLRTSVPRSTPS